MVRASALAAFGFAAASALPVSGLPLALLVSALALPSAFVLVSGIDQISRTLRKANLASVIQNLESDPGRLAVAGIGHRQVGQVDRRLLGDDAALLVCGLALMALHEVHAAHERALLLRHHLHDLAGAPLVATG